MKLVKTSSINDNELFDLKIKLSKVAQLVCGKRKPL